MPTTTPKLRLVARHTPTSELHQDAPCVPDPHGSDMTPQRRRCIGRVHKEVERGQWAWVTTGKVEEIPYHHDLRAAVVARELWPADSETANQCGVTFDPKCDGDTEAAAIIAKANAGGAGGEDKPKTSSGTKTTNQPSGDAGGKG